MLWPKSLSRSENHVAGVVRQGCPERPLSRMMVAIARLDRGFGLDVELNRAKVDAGLRRMRFDGTSDCGAIASRDVAPMPA